MPRKRSVCLGILAALFVVVSVHKSFLPWEDYAKELTTDAFQITEAGSSRSPPALIRNATASPRTGDPSSTSPLRATTPEPATPRSNSEKPKEQPIPTAASSSSSRGAERFRNIRDASVLNRCNALFQAFHDDKKKDRQQFYSVLSSTCIGETAAPLCTEGISERDVASAARAAAVALRKGRNRTTIGSISSTTVTDVGTYDPQFGFCARDTQGGDLTSLVCGHSSYRSRSAGVLVAPATNNQEHNDAVRKRWAPRFVGATSLIGQTGSTKQHKDDFPQLFFMQYQSLHLPQCDVWYALHCQALEHAATGAGTANVDFPAALRAASHFPYDLPLPHVLRSMLRHLWPSPWINGMLYQFCSKTGASASNPKRVAEYGPTKKKKWIPYNTNATHFFTLRGFPVAHYLGKFVVDVGEEEERNRNVDRTAAMKTMFGSKLSQPMVLNHSPFFHHVENLWPRDVYDEFTLTPTPLSKTLSQLQQQQQQQQPRVVRITTPVAYYAPPMDFTFSFHLYGDSLLPMLHGLRDQVMLGNNITVFLERPMRTRVTGFSKQSCHYGVEWCLRDSADAPGGEFGALFRYMIGGLDNIVFVDLNDDVVAASQANASASSKSTTKRPPAAFLELRQRRSRTYKTTLYKLSENTELRIASPSTCQVSTTIESSLLENSDRIRLGPGSLDCNCDTLWAFRVLVFRFLQEKMKRKPHVQQPDTSHAGVAASASRTDSSSLTINTTSTPTNATAAPLKATVASQQQKHKKSYFFHTSLFRPGENNGVVPSFVNDTAETRSIHDLPVDFESIHTECFGDRWTRLTAAPSRHPQHHIVFLVRRNTLGRVITNETEVGDALRSSIAKFAVERLKGNILSVRFTVATVASLSEAAQLLSSATILILTHGAAMLYLPLLRPNAAVVVADHLRPPIIPFVPTWIHWRNAPATCLRVKNGCNGIFSHRFVVLRKTAATLLGEKHANLSTNKTREDSHNSGDDEDFARYLDQLRQNNFGKEHSRTVHNNYAFSANQTLYLCQLVRELMWQQTQAAYILRV